ncbi:hypothetical protein ACWDV4_01735 [Micromonospora sp. NPDC003197]
MVKRTAPAPESVPQNCPSPCPPIERAAVAALTRLLPAGFRDRQQNEWTGDLVALAQHGAAARWQYLFWAAWTLPSLRLAASRSRKSTTAQTLPVGTNQKQGGLPVGLLRALTGVQFYVVAAYLAAAVIPYLWSPRPYPPTWLWIVPGWLLGVPGFFVTLLGPVLAIPLALAGLVALARYRRALSARMTRWGLVATALSTAYAVYGLTPLAHAMRIYLID